MASLRPLLRDLHPSLKLITYGIAFSILPFLLTSLWANLAAICLIVLLVVAMGIPYRQIKIIYPALGIVALTVISWLAVDIGGEVLVSIPLGPWVWQIKDANLLYAGRFAVRTGIWVGAYMIVLATTSNRDLVVGLERLRVPRAAAIAIAMTLKFWGQVTLDTQMVMEAQKARGVEFDKGPKLRLLRTRILATVLPVFFLMFKRFRTMSYALTLRGFGAPTQPSRYYDLPLRSADWAVWAVLMLAQVALVVADRIRVGPF